LALDVSKYKSPKRGISTKQKNVKPKKPEQGNLLLFESKLNDQKRLKIFGDLAVLISSGVDLKSVILLLQEEALSKAEESALSSIKAGIDKGKSLSDAMRDSNYFSEYEYHTIRIGEQTGKLAYVLEELAAYYQERTHLKRMVVRAMSYPLIVLFIAFAILYFMLQVVIPTFAEFFKQHDQELPDFTLTVISISKNLDTYLLIFFIGLAAILGIHQLSKHMSSYKNLTAKLLLSIPFVGKLIKEVYLARFTKSMGFLLEANVGLIESLDLVKNTIPFHPINASIDQIKADVIKGSPLNEAIAKHKIFGKRLVSLVKFGVSW